ncbi:transposase [Saccharomonospora sp. NPDC046836]|uniref:transposase n=1 Tax=Saccharomonospora sp. NPDC046836 TaxID=3156921 RepID=UPI0033CAA9C9
MPSEHSSATSRVQGSITKTGNTHLRRLLVEAAWHQRARYVAGKTIRDRWDSRRQPPGKRGQPRP